MRHPPRSPLFPYTPLFRSNHRDDKPVGLSAQADNAVTHLTIILRPPRTWKTTRPRKPLSSALQRPGKTTSTHLSRSLSTPTSVRTISDRHGLQVFSVRPVRPARHSVTHSFATN